MVADASRIAALGIGGVAGLLTLLTLWGWLSDNTSMLCTAGLLWLFALYFAVMIVKAADRGLERISNAVEGLRSLLGDVLVGAIQAIIYVLRLPGAITLGITTSIMEVVPDVHVMLALWNQPSSGFGLSDLFVIVLPIAIGFWANMQNASESNQTYAWVFAKMMATLSMCRGVLLLLCGFSGKEGLYQADGILSSWMTIYPIFELIAWPFGPWSALNLYRAIGADSFWVLFCLLPLIAAISYEIMAKNRPNDPVWDGVTMRSIWAFGFFTLPIGVYVLFKEVGFIWGVVIGAAGFFFWQTVRFIVTTLKVIAVLVGIAVALFVAFTLYDRWKPSPPQQPPQASSSTAPAAKKKLQGGTKGKIAPKKAVPVE